MDDGDLTSIFNDGDLMETGGEDPEGDNKEVESESFDDSAMRSGDIPEMPSVKSDEDPGRLLYELRSVSETFPEEWVMLNIALGLTVSVDTSFVLSAPFAVLNWSMICVFFEMSSASIQ